MSARTYDASGVLREMWDDPTQTYTAFNAASVQTSTRPYTITEIAALTVQNAQVLAGVNADTLRTRANAALTTNATYLALSAGALTPTASQQTVQVNKLTRECNILIRLVLSLLDDISGS